MFTFRCLAKYTFLACKVILRCVVILSQHVYIVAYIGYAFLLLPLRWLHPKLYWTVEGILFKWLIAIVASWGWCAGYTVTETGEDISGILDDEAVVMVNHQSTGDILTLMTCLLDKGSVMPNIMWLMDKLFLIAPSFGPVSFFHGDFFIQQGKQYRDSQIKLLRDHLLNTYCSRYRKWIVLFPEGGFLRKRRTANQRYARLNNLPMLEHITLPRIGAVKTILSTLRDPTTVKGAQNGPTCTRVSRKTLKWVVDITIGFPGYPDVRPMNLQTWVGGWREPTSTTVHYRYYPIKDVPTDPDDLTKWMYQRFVEKEHMLSHFYSTGKFPTHSQDSRITDEPRKVELCIWKILAINASYIVLLWTLTVLYSGILSPLLGWFQ
ncbi:acyl-CoA:lysophosphatidylglycerol acyltransferase 1-like [Ptychodera flava]|uniref:acyl-CoA:lysophosphatidylglycerol acyltransferase 1-like n=1 Tax=Ptychodera flava TaxID=63121 RepID=UPI00396AAC90